MRLKVAAGVLAVRLAPATAVLARLLATFILGHDAVSASVVRRRGC
jgi:hypothetical protein